MSTLIFVMLHSDVKQLHFIDRICGIRIEPHCTTPCDKKRATFIF